MACSRVSTETNIDEAAKARWVRVTKRGMVSMIWSKSQLIMHQKENLEAREGSWLADLGTHEECV